MRRLIALAAALLLSAGGLLAATGPPPITALAPLAPTAMHVDIGILMVPITLASVVTFSLLLAVMAYAAPRVTIIDLGSRLGVSFAMAAFARAVTLLSDLASGARLDKGIQRAIARIELTSEIPRQVLTAMKPRQFGPRPKHSRHEFAFSLN